MAIEVTRFAGFVSIVGQWIGRSDPSRSSPPSKRAWPTASTSDTPTASSVFGPTAGYAFGAQKYWLPTG